MAVDIPLDAPEWRREILVSAALAAGQVERKKAEALAEDLIILPDSFYDMNTWIWMALLSQRGIAGGLESRQNSMG